MKIVITQVMCVAVPTLLPQCRLAKVSGEYEARNQGRSQRDTTCANAPAMLNDARDAREDLLPAPAESS